jgi:hypothetical protein
LSLLSSPGVPKLHVAKIVKFSFSKGSKSLGNSALALAHSFISLPIYSFSESIANVNIPVPNGILSIRPAEMTSVDQSLINKIDRNTMAHLQQLKANLDLIMKNASNKFFK